MYTVSCYVPVEHRNPNPTPLRSVACLSQQIRQRLVVLRKRTCDDMVYIACPGNMKTWYLCDVALLYNTPRVQKTGHPSLAHNFAKC